MDNGCRDDLSLALKGLSHIAIVNKNYLSNFVLERMVRNQNIDFHQGRRVSALTPEQQNELAQSIPHVTHPIAREKTVAALALQRNPRWEKVFVGLMMDPSYEVRAAAIMGVALLPSLQEQTFYIRETLQARSSNVSLAVLFLIERHHLARELSLYRERILWPPEDPTLDRAMARVEAAAKKWKW